MNIGHKYIVLESIDSTNSHCKELLSKNQEILDGTVVRARHQFAGKGQQGSSWLSPPNQNLTLSIILQPFQVSVSQQYYGNMAITLACLDYVRDRLEKQAPDLKIKWPNDIYYKNEKLGGLLIETSLSGAFLNWLIAGIGINVLQQEFDPTLPNPSSFSLIEKRSYDLDEETLLLIRFINKWYLRFLQRDFAGIKAMYMQNLIGYRQIRKYEQVDSGAIFEASVQDIGPEGQLLLNTADGQQRSAFSPKEIRFVF